MQLLDYGKAYVTLNLLGLRDIITTTITIAKATTATRPIIILIINNRLLALELFLFLTINFSYTTVRTLVYICMYACMF